jgi:hypothetical protein
MTISKALAQLRPNAHWHLVGDEKYENIVWTDPNTRKPSREEVEPLAAQFVADHQAAQYRRDRKKQYPSVNEQLDMLWHAMDDGALPRVDSFYDAIKAVKDANPKP